jgi:hypothetical protein
VLHIYWDRSSLYALLRRGLWQQDILRWATRHRDPIRLANLNLARLLLERLHRDGQINGRFAHAAAPCYDEYGFGGELDIQFYRDDPNTEPVWPYVIPEDAEPDARSRSSLYVQFGRRSLFTCSWGFINMVPAASVYSDLGHFHGPLLRWAQSR